MSLRETLNERGSRYGKFSGHAWVTQNIKQHIIYCNKLSASQKEALEMIAHKIGRIINGDPNYKDSWVDIAGYAQLIVDELEEREYAELEDGYIANSERTYEPNSSDVRSNPVQGYENRTGLRYPQSAKAGRPEAAEEGWNRGSGSGVLDKYTGEDF